MKNKRQIRKIAESMSAKSCVATIFAAAKNKK
jgi:hypothetical protein